MTNVKLTAELIEGFAGGLLSKTFDEPAPTPACHREWWEMCCSPHQRVAIAAPRGHAKSTAITKCYTLAAVLFRVNDYVLVVSDTYNQACLFLGEIKRELTANDDLIELFDIKRDEEGKPFLVMDRENDIIITFTDGHQFRITAVGSEQKVRGLLWNGKRPNLIVGDDLENDEIVQNPDRREKFKNWVYNALLPCLSERGKVRIVGTILHMGSFLEGRMPADHSPNSIRSDLSVKMKRPINGWFSARYAAHGPDAKFDLLLWPVKWTEKRLKEVQETFISAGSPEGYYQEYLNRPIDPHHAFFKKDDFGEMSDADRELPWGHYPCFLSCDLAMSTKQRRDYSVFAIGSTDQSGLLYIRKVIRERIDSKEIVDTILRLKNTYGFNTMLIGKGTLEKAIGPYLREGIRNQGQFLHIEAIPEVEDKRSKAQSIRARMRAGGVKFDKDASWYPELEGECLQFDRGAHDDQVDSLALFGMYLDNLQTAASPNEIEEEMWHMEFKDSLQDQNNLGRGESTGY